jgi:hypothetical protein
VPRNLEPVVAVTVTMPDGEVRGYDATNGGELDLPREVQVVGLLKGLRAILGTAEGESILYQAALVARRARMWSAEHKQDTAIPEEDRQMILLGLALTSLLRPGFAMFAGDVAERLTGDEHGREVFERLRAANDDILPMVSISQNESNLIRTALRLVDLQKLIVDTEDQELVVKYEEEESERMAEHSIFQDAVDQDELVKKLYHAEERQRA